MLHEYNVDSFLGLQLLCCLDFEAVPPAIDPGKYALFLSLLRPDVVRLAAIKIERLRLEIENYPIKELLEEYCLLLPSEHRIEAYKNCLKILDLQHPLPAGAAVVLNFLKKQFDER